MRSVLGAVAASLLTVPIGSEVIIHAPAGAHAIELWDMGDAGGVRSHGTFDFPCAAELP